MTNALIFFNRNDFFGATRKGADNDIVSILKDNSRVLYKKAYDEGKIPDFPIPGSPELPWENDELWQKLKEIKTAMADCQHVNHYITPEITEKFYHALSYVLAYLHKKYFYVVDKQFNVFEKLLSSRYADDLYHLFFWLSGAKKLGIQAYLMSKEEFQEDYENNPKLMKELIEKIDIHVTFDLEQKYNPEFVSRIVQEGKIIVGHDHGTKAQFSFIPFMLNQYEQFCKNMPKPYLEAIQDFTEKYDGKMAQLIPPFISVPANIQFTKELVQYFQYFFKKICKKVIVKGSCSAANRGSDMIDLQTKRDVYCPYILLDVNATPENWFFELTNYYLRYGSSGSILIQAVVRDFDKAQEVEKKFEEAIVHKTTVVGDVAWRQCVRTIYYFFKDFWETQDARVMGTPADLHYYCKKNPTNEIGVLDKEGTLIQKFGTRLKGVLGVLHLLKYREHDFSDLKEEFADADQQLDMAGEYINLISPLGAHALDIVFGKIEEKGKRQMYLLEANGSFTRSDAIPVNYYAKRIGKDKKTIFDEYMEWALNICNGNKEQAGEYTKKMFFELEQKERAQYLEGVNKLWYYAFKYLTTYIIFCNNGKALLKSPAAVPV